MELEAAKMIGAGLAVLPLLGAGIGLGLLFSSIINAMGRNPSVTADVKQTAFLYFALVEATGLFGLGIALLIIFG